MSASSLLTGTGRRSRRLRHRQQGQAPPPPGSRLGPRSLPAAMALVDPLGRSEPGFRTASRPTYQCFRHRAHQLRRNVGAGVSLGVSETTSFLTLLAWPLTCNPNEFLQYWPRARQEDSPRPRTAPSAAQQPGTAGPLAIRHFTNSSSCAVQPVRLVIQPRFLQCFIQRHSSGNHALQCSRTPD